MELFTLISGISVFGFACIFFFYIFSVIRKRQKLKPTQFITYGKHKFNRDFAFTCEYCCNPVSTTLNNCPVCFAAYGANKEYKSKRKEINLAYLQFLKQQEQMIDAETKYINDMSKLKKRNSFLIGASYFNFDLQQIPPFKKSECFEFSCEYCDTKLNGRSDDGGVCINCSADYSDNVELLVAEQEERLERSHYTEYLVLQDIQWNANIDNDKKTRQQNKFWVDGIGKWLIGLVMLFVVIVIPATLYFIIKHFMG